MTRALWFSVAVSVAVSVSAPVAAHADAPTLAPDAQAHMTAGLAKYDAGDYDAASAELEAAYAIDPNPVLLYAWAQSEREAARCDHAVELYTRYLDSKPASQAQVDAATHGVAACQPAKPPPPPPPPPPPIATTAPPVIAPAPPAAPMWYRDVTADALAGTGAAAMIAGGVLLIAAHGAVSDAQSATTLDGVHAHLDSATTDRRAGAVLLIAGAALAGGGALLWLRHHHVETVSTDGHAVALGGHF
nr:hypothetical protein [Kofleriaceae bacterium]